MGKSKDAAALVVNEQFVEVISKVLTFFKGDIKKTRAWLVTGNPNFGGVPPLKLIVLGKINKVLDFIDAAADEEGWLPPAMSSASHCLESDRKAVAAAGPREWTLKKYESVGAPEILGPQLQELEEVRVREIKE